MDPLFERLGRLFRSNLGAGRAFEDDLRTHRWADPDLRSAMQDLDDFLDDRPGNGPHERGPRRAGISPELKKDFATLNVSSDASPGQVKLAYRELLRSYHPDRFAADPEKFRTATEITSRINQAYQRIQVWFDKA
jgi:DnaJ-domain-containing protein 1